MSELLITLLGTLQILQNGAPVNLRYDKVRGLLAFLLMERRAHLRGALANLLWPEVAEADARQSLNQALFTLCQALGEHTAVTPVVLSDPDQSSRGGAL